MEYSCLVPWPLLMPANQTFRVFPLPGMILFPGMLLPLRIFEPRYRQLLEKSLKNDRLIAMTMVHPQELEQIAGDPQIFMTAGVGEIVHCEQLEDKTFRVILEGRYRIRLIREQPKEGLVRIFTGKKLKGILHEKDRSPTESLVETLKIRVKMWVEKRLPESVHQSVLQRLDESISIGDCLDRIAALVVHVVAHRQALLETADIYQRAKMLENLTRWAGARGPFGHTTMN